MTENAAPAATTAVSTPRSILRSPWMVPGVVAVAVAGAFLAPPLLANAGAEGLPDLTPAELAANVAAAESVPLSGTVVYTARLGLPEIPTALTGANPLALLGGSSTLRVWTDGEDRSRVALLGDTSEYSVVRDGPEAWTYSSTDEEVVHYALDAAGQARYAELEAELREGPSPDVAADLPTPEEAASAALDHADESSTVSMDASTTVAGRDAYQLVVSPKTQGSLVGRVVVAVDAETWTPLRVQVWSTQDAETPALELGFTDVTFATPDDAVLAFAAPADAAVRDVIIPLPDETDLAVPDAAEAPTDATGPEDAPLPEGVTVTGTGWETVVEISGIDVQALLGSDPAAMAGLASERLIGSDEAQELVGEFVPEDGEHPGSDLDLGALYGTLTTEVPEGQVISSALLTVLLTPDGRVLVGAVPAETLRGMA